MADAVQVVVVGVGPAGAVVSHALACAGIDVTCLEQGDRLNPTDYATNSANACAKQPPDRSR